MGAQPSRVSSSIPLEAAIARLCVTLLRARAIVTWDKPWAEFFAASVSERCRTRLFRDTFPSTELPEQPHQLVEAVAWLLAMPDGMTAALTITPADLSRLRPAVFARLANDVLRATTPGRTNPAQLRTALQELHQAVCTGQAEPHPGVWEVITAERVAAVDLFDFLNLIALVAGDWENGP
jgi:hypothetical protein